MSKIALLPGGFKPPHVGHYDMALKFFAESKADKLIIFVGPKERDGITQVMSINLWKLYTQNDLGLEIRPAGISPVRDVYDFIEKEAPEGSTVYLGMGEKDSSDQRYANIGKFAEPRDITFKIKLIKPQGGGISGTDMRGFVQSDDKELFKKGIPNHIDKDKAWNIVIGLNEDLYDPNDHYYDFAKSSEYKAGYTKPDDITPGYKYRRGGQYSAASGQGGAGTMYEADEKGKTLHAYDFDDTIARVKANIRTTITSPNGDYNKEILIPAENFPEESKALEARLGSLEIKYNFSEFEKQIDDAIVNSKVVNKLKDSLSRSEVKTTILTARSIGHPVTRYMREELGLAAYVVPLGLQVDGKVTGQDKADWIENHINKGYKTIYFIDDSEENRTAVSALKDKYPDIKLTVEDPAAVRELNEGKQVGTLYHYADLFDIENIIKQNKLKASNNPPSISFTRVMNNDLKMWFGGGDDLIILVIDGDKLSQNYKIRPYRDFHPDMINPETGQEIDEYEERVDRDISNLDKYIIKVIIPNSFPEIESLLKEKGIPYEVENLSEMMGMMNKQEKAKHAKNMKRLNKDMSNMKGNNYGGGGYKVPNYVKGTLTRKLYEMEDHELKYWALYADLVKKLDTPDAEETYARLKQKLTGEKLDALNYFYHTYFKEDSPENLEMTEGLSNKEKAIVDDIIGNTNDLQEIVMKNILDKIKNYSKKGLLTLAITLAVASSVSAQTTDTDTIKFLDQVIMIDDIKTNKEYYQAILSLVHEDLKNDPTNEFLIEVKNMYLELIEPTTEMHNIGVLSDKALDIEYKYKQLLTNNPKKAQFHINNGKKYSTGESNININESKLFSKDWWTNIIKEHLLTEGGAAGHMAHPFNLSFVNSGKDLKDVIEKAAVSLEKNPGAVKIDGVNSSIRLVDIDGKKQFALDRGSKQALDIKGVTKSDLENRFKTKDGSIHGFIKTGGDVLDMFNEALPSLKSDLEKLGAWEDPNILFNMEYVSGKTNVQKYESNFIAIHGLNKIEMVNEPSAKTGKILSKRKSTEMPYDKNALQSLLNNLTPTAKKRGFEVYGSVETEMTKKPNFGSALSKNYTIKSNEGDKSQSLDRWLSELNNIPEEASIFMGGIKRPAVGKQVYMALLNGGNIDELFKDEDDKIKAIEGFTTYLATEKLGDEILKVLDSPMGSVENHEGVVIRDKNIADVPFKITGKFILGGMQTGFRENKI